MSRNTALTGQRPRLATVGCLVAGGLTVLIVLALGIGLVISGLEDYRSQAKLYQGIHVTTPPPAPYALSQDQKNLVQANGYPESFTIYFYEEYDSSGSVEDVRFETWSYYTQGKRYTFFNGTLDQVTDLPVLNAKPLANPYKPEQFQAYESVEQVLAATGINAVLLTPLEKELVPGGEVYYANMLTFGLKDGELRYVGTIALEE
jgi:hypothetical protein